jgi:hypothetical protein
MFFRRDYFATSVQTFSELFELERFPLNLTDADFDFQQKGTEELE